MGTQTQVQWRGFTAFTEKEGREELTDTRFVGRDQGMLLTKTGRQVRSFRRWRKRKTNEKDGERKEEAENEKKNNLAKNRDDDNIPSLKLTQWGWLYEF